MITISFDEAGNTGQHLTNPDQPLFTLASINLSDAEAIQLLSNVRGSDNHEAHYVKLRKSNKGRRNMISLLSDPLIAKKYVKVGVYHKRYMVMAKAIDLLVEPMAANDGIDLYSNGACLAMSNMHFICMHAFCGDVNTNEFFEKLVKMIRIQTDTAIDDFYNHIMNMAKAVESKHKDYSQDLMLLWATRQFVKGALVNCDLATLDPAIPAYVDLVSEWGDQLNQEFITLHDKSKILAQYRKHLLPLMDQEKTPIVLRIGPKMRTFPLKAIDLILVDSENHEAIQIADIIAGSISHLIRAKVGLILKDDFAKELQELNIEEMIVNSVWPSDKIERYEVNGQEDNPADVMAAFMRKRKDADDNIS